MDEELLNTLLEDDDASFGGVSFDGETVRDFIEEVGLDEDITIDELNYALAECGIKEITR